MVKYIHLRVYDEAHGGPLSKGGITFAYDIQGDQIRYTMSKCNDKDHYNKKIGRAIASGRLAKGIGVTVLLAKEGHTATERVLDNFTQEYEAHLTVTA